MTSLHARRGKIIERIIAARKLALSLGTVPNRMKMPTGDFLELTFWIAENLENDPILGFQPFGDVIFGMKFSEDATLTDLVLTTEDPL